MTEEPPAGARGQVRFRCVTVFGGTGFVGAAITARLAAAGMRVRVAARRPRGCAHDAGTTEGGRIFPVEADVRDAASVTRALEGADAVVNAVGLYVEDGAGSFEAVHEEGARRVAEAAADMGVGRLVHISGIGADPLSPSAYVRARGVGDRSVRDAFPNATILKPSAIFAPHDRFINMLAESARFSPVMPLFGRGLTRLQPVYLEDVAEAALAALCNEGTAGATYELGGPRSYTYRELIRLVLARSGRRRILLPVPFAVWDLLVVLAALLPRPPLTEAQVTLMRGDNVASAGTLSFEHLGIAPTAIEDVLASYDL